MSRVILNIRNLVYMILSENERYLSKEGDMSLVLKSASR